MNKKEKTLIVVLGPTGVGKTELCLSLAEHLSIPIINADSRQIFAELPIGTAAIRNYFRIEAGRQGYRKRIYQNRQ